MTQKERALLIALGEWALDHGRYGEPEARKISRALYELKLEVQARESAFTKAIRAGGIDPLGDVT